MSTSSATQQESSMTTTAQHATTTTGTTWSCTCGRSGVFITQEEREAFTECKYAAEGVTGSASYVNDCQAAGEQVATMVNEAQAAGHRVEVNGREVHSRWTRRMVAQVYQNGTVEVQVRGRRAGTQGYVYVRQGSSVTVTVTTQEG